MSVGTSEGTTGTIDVTLTPDVIVSGDGISGIPAPVIVSVAQYGTIIVARVQLPTICTTELVAVSLFRSLTGLSGSWGDAIDACQVDYYELATDLVDTNPILGRGVYYAAACSTIADATSPVSVTPILYSASAAAAAASIASAAGVAS